jgi:uncharacterized protein
MVESRAKPKTLTRRRFLKRALWSLAGVTAIGAAYTSFEAGWIEVVEETIRLPRLPQSFAGFRIAFLTDLHHGPFTSLSYIQTVVEMANSLLPDVICLGGDYIHRGSKYIEPSINALGDLHAPHGVFAVLGNHDHWHGAEASSRALAAAGIRELTNTGVWLESRGERLRFAGVDDLWNGAQDIDAALADTTDSDACVVLSHNPDYAETLRDSRVGLVLSGHTHGGQAVFPVIGAPIVPSAYGQKYVRGLVQAPTTRVYVSRGLGTITPPLRFCCRPEISLLTLE